eukprot:jgi/Mesvir1/22664/Mv14096-RA.1
MDDEAAATPDVELHCKLDCVQGLVDALVSVRWKKQQDAIIELSEHGILIIVDEHQCLQGRVYFRTDLFQEFRYRGPKRCHVAVSLTVLTDCLSTFTSGFAGLEVNYPGPDGELVLRARQDSGAGGSTYSSMDAYVKTSMLDLEDLPTEFALKDDEDGVPPASFAVKASALKEVIEDLEWPASNVDVIISPDPQEVVFNADGHGSLQIELINSYESDLFINFVCESKLASSYKHKYLKATTCNIPAGVLRDHRGSKVSMDYRGLLKVQHIISMRGHPVFGMGGGGSNSMGGGGGVTQPGGGGTGIQTERQRRHRVAPRVARRSRRTRPGSPTWSSLSCQRKSKGGLLVTSTAPCCVDESGNPTVGGSLASSLCKDAIGRCNL